MEVELGSVNEAQRSFMYHERCMDLSFSRASSYSYDHRRAPPAHVDAGFNPIQKDAGARSTNYKKPTRLYNTKGFIQQNKGKKKAA